MAFICSSGCCICNIFGGEKMRDFFKGFKEGFHDFTNIIISIVNFVLLFIVYFVGVGITAVFAKAAGKKFLNLKSKKSKQSYWVHKKIGNEPEEEHYRQF